MLNITFKEFEEQCSDIDLSIEWCTGGVTGGSCWGTPHENYTSNEKEPKKHELILVLKKFCANISALQILEILESDDLYLYSEYTYNDYYGNYDNYIKRTLNLNVLYDILINLEND